MFEIKVVLKILAIKNTNKVSILASIKHGLFRVIHYFVAAYTIRSLTRIVVTLCISHFWLFCGCFICFE